MNEQTNKHEPTNQQTIEIGVSEIANLNLDNELDGSYWASASRASKSKKNENNDNENNNNNNNNTKKQLIPEKLANKYKKPLNRKALLTEKIHQKVNMLQLKNFKRKQELAQTKENDEKATEKVKEKVVIEIEDEKQETHSTTTTTTTTTTTNTTTTKKTTQTVHENENNEHPKDIESISPSKRKQTIEKQTPQKKNSPNNTKKKQQETIKKTIEKEKEKETETEEHVVIDSENEKTVGNAEIEIEKNRNEKEDKTQNGKVKKVKQVLPSGTIVFKTVTSGPGLL